MQDGSTRFVECRGKITGQTPAPPPAEAAATGSVLLSAPGVNVSKESPAANKYYEFLQAHYQFDIDSYSHARAVFHWQHISSIIIFWIVVILVVSGLILAGLQLRDKNTLTTITFSATGKVEIKSPVIGLLILGFSLGFFYSYLRYVYPIQNINAQQTQSDVSH